jgi:hypothetical protein
MALFNECMQSCALIVLDTADIVRDGDFSTTTKNHPNPIALITQAWSMRMRS